MQEPLSRVVEENAEEIVCQYHGADEATATVEREIEDPKRFFLEITFDGEIVKTDEIFYAQMEEDQRIQSLKIFERVNDYTILAKYTMVDESRVENMPEDLEDILN